MSEAATESPTTTTTFYKIRDDGKKVKITRTVTSEFVPASMIEERKNWPRYAHGNEINVSPKADQEINLNFLVKHDKQPKKATVPAAKVKCRVCGSNHMTINCPIKDKVISPENLINVSAPAPPAAGKYVSPSRRAAGPGAGGPGAPGGSGIPVNLEKFVPPGVRAMRPGMMHSQDSENTLRVSNIPETVDEHRLRRKFSTVGQVVRCHVSRHHDTNVGRGFAFVAYATRVDAERAKERFNGMPIDQMIMHVDFAQPRN
ncbi:translation initiation factor eIF3 core subunit G [Starmerella bacillaris]|uniref:Translation initiation factor eIF3 core subunit G n=1 Tax=Starmerella bacillaris TaxID=1247836 RepID=A0AAV5RK87_STABA|nr:translation initiation factor eIF3 core subunit G [Starmerella bacillaris]